MAATSAPRGLDDPRLPEVLAAIGNAHDARAVLFMAHRGDRVVLLAQWARPGTQAYRPTTGGRPTSEFPRFRERLTAGIEVRIDDVANMSDDWSSEHAFLAAVGARAALLLPAPGQPTSGHVMILRDGAGWTDREVRSLRASVAPLHRMLTHDASGTHTHRDWTQLHVHELPLAMAVLDPDGAVVAANPALLDLLTPPSGRRPAPSAAFDRIGAAASRRLRHAIGLVLDGVQDLASAEIAPFGSRVRVRVSRLEMDGVGALLCLDREDLGNFPGEIPDFETARALGWIRLAYQPIVSPVGAVLGAEALLRVDHPVLGTISTEDFLAGAESTGVAHLLDRWVFETALGEAEELLRHRPDLVLSLNLSPETLGSGAAADLAAIVEASALPGPQVRIEVLESSELTTDLAVADLQWFRALGCSVAVDDFGTGYTALAQLSRLPIDTVKLDRSMIQLAQTSARARTVTDGAVATLTELGVEVIAEGIETSAEHAYVRELGCAGLQGWLFAPAMALRELIELPAELTPGDQAFPASPAGRSRGTTA